MCQRSAAVECVCFNFRDGIRNGDIAQRCTMIECESFDRFQISRQLNRFQVRALIERFTRYGYAFRNADRAEPLIVAECTCVNPDDRHPVDLGRNGNIIGHIIRSLVEMNLRMLMRRIGFLVGNAVFDAVIARGCFGLDCRGGDARIGYAGCCNAAGRDCCFL